MFYIRQNATHKVVIGPVVAVANGYVPVTTLALNTADEAEVILHDNGTVVDISAYTFAAITTADGYYHLTLQSGISGTVGHMTVVINDDSLCLPVKAEFTVLEEAVYDQYFAASAAGAQVPIWSSAGATVNLSATTIKTATDVETDTADIQSRLPAALTAGGNIKADALAFSGDTVAADNAESFFDGTGYAGTNNVIPTVTTLTNLPAITANWLTAAGIAAGALDGKGNWNIGKTGYTLTATTGLGNQTADITGNLSGSVGSVTGAVGSVTGAVGSVTGNVGGNVVGSVGSVAGAVASVTATVNADIKKVNGITVDGAGTSGDPWGPV